MSARKNGGSRNASRWSLIGATRVRSGCGATGYRASETALTAYARSPPARTGRNHLSIRTVQIDGAVQSSRGAAS